MYLVCNRRSADAPSRHPSAAFVSAPKADRPMQETTKLEFTTDEGERT